MNAPSGRSARIHLALVCIASVIAGSAALAVVPALATSRAQETKSEGSDSAQGAPTETDGVIPDGATSAFDKNLPAIANLDPRLLDALTRAASDAAEDGVNIRVNSGWRSRGYQEHLQREAIDNYGSAEEAARWVAPPTASAHVSGDAVDVGEFDATYWLSLKGDRYGLCQIYANEPWHYEFRPHAVADGCPSQFMDPTEDPRLKG